MPIRTPVTFGFVKLIAVGALFVAAWRCISHGRAAEEVNSTIPEVGTAKQLIVVKTADWSAVPATVELFERTDAGGWRRHGVPFPAVTGRSGLRWGLGLHGGAPAGVTGKREGDGRAPAGVFELDQVFGYSSAEAAGFLKMPYVVATRDLEGVYDPASKPYYNRLVDRTKVSNPDWKHSEKMLNDSGLYRWGIVVRHNWAQKTDYGSCIFLHIWRGPGSGGTAGCTAFPAEEMDKLLHWLDHRANPLLVQLPEAEYARRKPAWRLP